MSSLPEIVDSEAETIRRFVVLLREEQAALGAGLVDSLSELIDRKSSVAEELAAIAARRNAALASEGFAPDRIGIEGWLAQASGADAAIRNSVAAGWASVLAQAGEARELNRLNGELIQVRMRHNSQALEALLGASRPLSLYGPDGQTTAPGARRINDAA